MKKLALFAMLLVTNMSLAQQKFNFQPLVQLTGGSWQMKSAKGIYGEKWKNSGANELKSEAFKVIGKDTTLLEKVQLIRKENNIYYVVSGPNSGNTVAFKLIESKNNRFIFSNPNHDFPQRIVYHFVTKDSIHAFVDGKTNGKFMKQDFYYKRVK